MILKGFDREIKLNIGLNIGLSIGREQRVTLLTEPGKIFSPVPSSY